MSDEDHHPELLLLHETGGEIEGRGKYHKLLDRYRREPGDTDVNSVLKERGPFNEGLSRSIKRYIDMGIVETDEEGQSRDVKETEKGKRYVSGFERTKSYLDDSFQSTRNQVQRVALKYGNKSMNELVQEPDVQEDKQRSLGTPLPGESESKDQE
jgi:hypothetical protein